MEEKLDASFKKQNYMFRATIRCQNYGFFGFWNVERFSLIDLARLLHTEIIHKGSRGYYS